MQKYKLFGLAPPIWVAQYIYSIDIQRIIKCESKRCQSQEAHKKSLFIFIEKQPFV
jgi:hypothetical protein